MGASTQLKVEQKVQENQGNVKGVEVGTVYGDVISQIRQVNIVALNRDGRAAGWKRFVSSKTPPYRFLEPYREKDHAIFHGRETEIGQVIRRIAELSELSAPTPLFVFGPTGVGKTSLLWGGVVPELSQMGALVVRIEEYERATEDIRDGLLSLNEEMGLEIPSPSDGSLQDAIRAFINGSKGSLVLVLDQFERLFEPSVPEKGRSVFLSQLQALLGAVDPLYLRIIAVAPENLQVRLAQLDGIFPEFLRYSYVLSPLTATQGKQAIVKPLEALESRVSYVGDLVDRLLIPDLDELTPELPGRIYPPHLQVVCHYLYRAAVDREPPLIDDALYLETGKGADGILARYLQDALGRQLPAERELAEQILTSMASPGVERWRPAEKLGQNGGSLDRVNSTLKHLTDMKLLVRRAVNEHFEYAFASPSVAEEVRRLAGPLVESRFQAQDELERVWSSWLAIGAFASRLQLRFLRQRSEYLEARPAKALLLLKSAVARNEPVAGWRGKLDTSGGRSLIKQLEEGQGMTPAVSTSASALSKAKALLGLLDQPNASFVGGGSQTYGPISAAAVFHPESVTRQAAALVLTVPYGLLALDRLNWALKAKGGRWSRRARLAELRGSLSDADAEVEKQNSDLPFVDRVWVWAWRARRRVILDLYWIAALSLGGAVGAGLGLGALRLLLALPAKQLGSVQFAIHSYWGAILGAALTLGILLSDVALLKRDSDSQKQSIFSRAPFHPDRLPLLLAAGVGGLFFGLAHVVVTWLNGLPLGANPLLYATGLLAGIGLSLALFGLPLTGWRQSWLQWLGRLVAAVVAFSLGQSLVFILDNTWVATSVTMSSKFFADHFTRYLFWQDLAANTPSLNNLASIVDSALVGVVLTVGTAAGLSFAMQLLPRLQTLVEFAEDREGG